MSKTEELVEALSYIVSFADEVLHTFGRPATTCDCAKCHLLRKAGDIIEKSRSDEFLMSVMHTTFHKGNKHQTQISSA